MGLFSFVLPKLQDPATHMLLQLLIKQFLSDSYCLTYVSDEPVDFNFDVTFTFMIPKNTVEELKDQLLVVSEDGCSDYIVNMRDRKIFMTAFDMVSKTASVRRSDRKIIFMPISRDVNNTEKALDLFSMRETDYVASIVVILPNDEDKGNCEIFDLVTHKFTGSSEEIHQVMFLNQWDSCTNEFKSNNSLFPHDLKDLFGKVVKVGTFSYLPYNILDLDPGVTASGRDGMEIRIVEEFCRWTNCTIEIVNENVHQWGEVFENGTGNGVIGSVVDDRADIGISGIYSWYEEFVYADFSTPSIRSSVTCLAPSPRMLPSWAMPLRPFSSSMWCAVIITFLFTSLALVLAKGCSSDRVFLTVMGLMISQSQKQVDESWRLRFATGWLLVAGLILVSAYGGGLASTFTVPKYEPYVDTMQDLVDRNMEWAATHDAWVFSLTLSDEPMIKQVINLYQTYPEEVLRRKSFDRKTAFGIEKMPGGHYAVGEYLTLEALGDMTVMVEDFYYGEVIAVLRKSSVYTEKLSVLIGRLQQSGLMLAWETQVALKHLNLKVQQEVKMSRLRKNVGSVKPLDTENVVGIFILYAIGVVLSILVFIIERLMKNTLYTSKTIRAIINSTEQ